MTAPERITGNLDTGDVFEHVQVLRLEPGDTLVLKTPRALTAEEADRIRQQLENRFPGYPALVISGDMDLSVVEQGDPHTCDLPRNTDLRKVTCQGCAREWERDGNATNTVGNPIWRPASDPTCQADS